MKDYAVVVFMDYPDSPVVYEMLEGWREHFENNLNNCFEFLSEDDAEFKLYAKNLAPENGDFYDKPYVFPANSKLHYVLLE